MTLMDHKPSDHGKGYPHMPKEEWGTKRVCPTTGKRFYDLNANPIVSPYTGEAVEIDASKTRMIAADMAEATGQAVSVVNRPGGGDGPFPGALEVLEAPADGSVVGSFVIGVPIVGPKIDIGIEEEQDIACCGIGTLLAGPRFAEPILGKIFAGNHSRPEGGRDLGRRVGGLIINHDELVGRLRLCFDRGKKLGEVLLFVPRGDDDGYLG